MTASGHGTWLLADYGDEALRGDRDLFDALNAQRDLDSMRFAYDRPLLYASRAAFEAWSAGRYDEVVRLLEPFRGRLITAERDMLDAAEGRSGGRTQTEPPSAIQD